MLFATRLAERDNWTGNRMNRFWLACYIMHVVAVQKEISCARSWGRSARTLAHSMALSWCVFAARKIRDGDREKALFSMGAKRMPLSPQETAEQFLSLAACPASYRLRHFLFSFLLFFWNIPSCMLNGSELRDNEMFILLCGAQQSIGTCGCCTMTYDVLKPLALGDGAKGRKKARKLQKGELPFCHVQNIEEA